MKKIKLLFDKYITKTEKLNPRLYRFFTYDLYRNVYSPLINYIKYKDKYFFNEIAIETSTYCNRKCDYCPNSYNETPKEYMKEEIFYEFVNQLQNIKYSGIFSYAIYNEPLFDERLPKFVSYVKEKLPKCIQILTSNGDILTVEKAIELEKAGIDKFVITIHDKNPQKAYNRLLEVKKVLKYKMRLQTSYDLVLQNRGGEIDIKKYKNYKKINKCQHIRKLPVCPNGDIILCCNDYYRKHVFGNIMKDNIIDIWNRYSNLREELLSKNIVKLDICKKCLEIEQNRTDQNRPEQNRINIYNDCICFYNNSKYKKLQPIMD